MTRCASIPGQHSERHLDERSKECAVSTRRWPGPATLPRVTPGRPVDDMQADVLLAMELADVAAQITMAAFGGRHDVQLKADQTPVTKVDAAAERALREILAHRRPADGIRGEEGGITHGSSGRVWVIDPIDGTRMFAEGIPLWTTLIGLRLGGPGGQVVVGVADAPALGERYHAARGSGAFCNNSPIRVSVVEALGDSLVLHAPLEEFSRRGGSGHDALLRVVERARVTRGVGDAWAHLLVARGAVEALVEQGPCYEWDWSATSVIVAEAGGCLTQLNGEPPEDGCHLLVTNGLVHDEIRHVMGADVVAEARQR